MQCIRGYWADSWWQSEVRKRSVCATSVLHAKEWGWQ